jgi:hypothetical protein
MKKLGMKFKNIDIIITEDVKYTKTSSKRGPRNIHMFLKKAQEIQDNTYIHPKILNFTWDVVKEWKYT